MQQLGQFLKLYKELKNEGVTPVVLKGPMLSQRLYGDPFYRTSNDFDLLFRETELNDAISFFEKRGFYGSKFKWPNTVKRQNLAREMTNQYVMYHPEFNVLIELHWKLFDRRFANPETVWKIVEHNKTVSELNGQLYVHLDGEFELLYLVIHGSMHAWFRLKWLVDIQQILNQQEVDKKVFIELVKKLGAERFVSVCNKVLQKFYPDGERLPGNWKPEKRQSRIALAQIQRPDNDPFNTFKNTMELEYYQISLSPRWRYKADIFRLMLFNKKDLEITWIPSYSYMLYLFRPLSYALRKAGFL